MSKVRTYLMRPWEAALNPSIAAAEKTDPGSSPDGDLGFVASAVWDRVAGA